MDAYKTPGSDLTIDINLPFKPVKAVLYGLTISLILTTIVSIIVLFSFGFMTGADFTNEESLNALYSNNHLFMFIDILISLGIFYYCGTVVGKHTVSKEIKYAVIVSILTLIIAATSFVMTESFSKYPMWYILSSFVIIPVGIYFGAKSKT